MDSEQPSNENVPVPPTRPAIDSGSSAPAKDRTASYQRRLRTAMATVDENSKDTRLRAMLSGYYRFIARSMARSGGVEFPVSLRRHPVHPGRGSTGDTKPNVFFFHIGDAIYSMYEASSEELVFAAGASTMGPKTREKAAAAVEKRYDELERRVRLIELIAKYGFSEFIIDGSDSLGYVLLPNKTVKDYEAVRMNQEKLARDAAYKDHVEQRRKGLFPGSVAREEANVKEYEEDGFSDVTPGEVQRNAEDAEDANNTPLPEE